MPTFTFYGLTVDANDANPAEQAIGSNRISFWDTAFNDVLISGDNSPSFLTSSDVFNGYTSISHDVSGTETLDYKLKSIRPKWAISESNTIFRYITGTRSTTTGDTGFTPSLISSIANPNDMYNIRCKVTNGISIRITKAFFLPEENPGLSYVVIIAGGKDAGQLFVDNITTLNVYSSGAVDRWRTLDRYNISTEYYIGLHIDKFKDSTNTWYDITDVVQLTEFNFYFFICMKSWKKVTATTSLTNVTGTFHIEYE